jgi:hypothetical protein
VGAKHGTNIITGIMTTFGEKISENTSKFYYTLQIFITSRNSSILKIQYIEILLLRTLKNVRHIPGMYGSAVGIKEYFVPIKFRNNRCPVNM